MPEKIMPSIRLTGINITKIHGALHTNQMQYDGEVRFIANADRFRFDYPYTFDHLPNLDEAVRNGIDELKKDLTKLLNAADTVQIGQADTVKIRA